MIVFFSFGIIFYMNFSPSLTGLLDAEQARVQELEAELERMSSLHREARLELHSELEQLRASEKQLLEEREREGVVQVELQQLQEQLRAEQEQHQEHLQKERAERSAERAATESRVKQMVGDVVARGEALGAEVVELKAELESLRAERVQVQAEHERELEAEKAARSAERAATETKVKQVVGEAVSRGEAQGAEIVQLKEKNRELEEELRTNSRTRPGAWNNKLIIMEQPIMERPGAWNNPSCRDHSKTPTYRITFLPSSLLPSDTEKLSLPPFPDIPHSLPDLLVNLLVQFLAPQPVQHLAELVDLLVHRASPALALPALPLLALPALALPFLARCSHPGLGDREAVH